MEDYLKTAILAVVESTVKFHSQLVVKGDMVVTVDMDDPLHLTLDNIFCIKQAQSEKTDEDSVQEKVNDADVADSTTELVLLRQMKEEIIDLNLPSNTSPACNDQETPTDIVDAPEDAMTESQLQKDVALPSAPVRRSSRRVSSKWLSSLTPRKRKQRSQITSMEKKIKVDPDITSTTTDPELASTAPNPEFATGDDTKDPGNDHDDTALKMTIVKASTSQELEDKLEENGSLNDTELLKMTSKDIIVSDGFYTCARCNFSDPKRFRVKRHLQVHGVATVPCQFCDQMFVNRADYKSHCDEEHSGEKPSCMECGKRFATLASLRIHQENVQRCAGSGVNRSCGYCSYTTNHYGNLLKHVQNRHGNNSLSCLFCSKAFKNKVKLNSHIKNNHSEDKLTCCLCSKSVHSPAGLTKHINLEHVNHSPDLHTCKGCDFSTPSLKALQRHQSSTEYSLKCYVCDTVTVCREQLRQHMLDEHPSKANKKQCNFCTKTFSSKNGLYTHNRVFHSGETDPDKRKTCTCHICGKGFPIYDYLKRHIRSHDASYEPYECPKCGRKFKYHRNCKTHKEGCMNSDGYPCDICGKVLKNEYCLREHVRNRHTEEKKNAYPCRKCGLMFSYSGSRSKHEKVCAIGKHSAVEEQKEEGVEVGEAEEESSEPLPVQVIYDDLPGETKFDESNEDAFVQDDEKVNLELAVDYQESFSVIEDVIIEQSGDVHTPIPVAYEEISSRIAEPHLSEITHVTLSEVPALSDGSLSIEQGHLVSATMSPVQTLAVMTGSLDHLHGVETHVVHIQ